MSGFRNKPAALSSGLRRNRFGLMEPIDFDVQPEGPLVAGKGSYSSPFGTLLYGLFLVASLSRDDAAAMLDCFRSCVPTAVQTTN